MATLSAGLSIRTIPDGFGAGCTRGSLFAVTQIKQRKNIFTQKIKKIKLRTRTVADMNKYIVKKNNQKETFGVLQNLKSNI